jgi:ribosomal protein L16 Arg81 hydroxylase
MLFSRVATMARKKDVKRTRVPTHEAGPRFADLIAPVAEEAFFADYWTKQPLVSRQAPALLEGLFDLDDLERYLVSVQPGVGSLLLVKEGKPAPTTVFEDMFREGYSTQTVYAAFSEGYTIVLNFVHERWPPVKRLTTHLEEVLQCKVQTNIYITGESSQGFNVHSDLHDVLILQTHGAKNWTIYPKPGGGDAPLMELVLEEGTVLYMPQGFPHAAHTASGFSVHLSIGIHHYTWLDLAGDALRNAAALDPAWRQPVPWAVLRGLEPPPKAADIEARFRSAFASEESVGAAIAAYKTRLADSAHRRNPAPTGYVRSLMGLGKIDGETRVRRRPGVGCTVAQDFQGAAICFLGRLIRAPLHAADALEFVGKNESFRVRDLPGTLSDRSKAVLVRRLIREGLLQAEA